MAKLKLKKKNYLGEGFVHIFVDGEGKEVTVPCTKKEYESLSGKGGSKNNPKLSGHTWKVSYSGTIAVDNPDSVLQIGEYCEIGDEVIARVEDANGFEFKRAKTVKMDKSKDEIEKTDLKKY